MVVRVWLCNIHGRQVTMIADGPLARCPVCSAPMFAVDSEPSRKGR